MREITIKITPQVEAMISLIQSTRTKPPTPEQIEKKIRVVDRLEGDPLSFEEAADIAINQGAISLTRIYTTSKDAAFNCARCGCVGQIDDGLRPFI